MKLNKLCINAQKSTALIIPSNLITISVPKTPQFFGKSAKTISKSAKYQGVQIDDDLMFRSHIQSLHTKFSRSRRILFKSNNICPAVV